MRRIFLIAEWIGIMSLRRVIFPYNFGR